jgi:hypothetical protein
MHHGPVWDFKTLLELIHEGLVGYHSSRNVMLRVLTISPNWSGSRLGVAQGMKLTSFGCESGG